MSGRVDRTLTHYQFVFLKNTPSLVLLQVFVDGLVATVQFGYGGGDEEDLGPSTVWVLRGRSRRSPTRGRGMDELGFFPYSFAETNDRIELIERALSSEHQIPDKMREALDDAARKLREWRVELER